MPIDQLQSQKKTIITLSKPYHSGKLLIDVIPSQKTVIISPNKVQITQDSQEPQALQKTEEKQSETVTKVNTIFDEFTSFDKIFDPKAKAQYRDASEIQIKTTTTAEPQPTLEQQEVAQNTPQKSVISNIKSLTDVNKKPTSPLTILSKKKPQITIEPLHSKSRVLATTSPNREIIKKLTQKRIDLKIKLMQQKKQAATENYSPIKDFATNNENIDFATKESFTFKKPEKFDSSNFQFYPGFKKPESESSRINLDELSSHLHESNLRKKIRRTNKIKRYSLSTVFATMILVICTVFLTGNTQWLGQINNKNVLASKSLDKKSVKYEQWIQAQNNDKYSPPGADLDQDGLNNFEEYLIDSNPNNKNSCYNGQTDNENLINLIDPVTCKPIDLKNRSEVEKFAPILNISSQFINAIPLNSQPIEQNIVETNSSYAQKVFDIIPKSSAQSSATILTNKVRIMET